MTSNFVVLFALFHKHFYWQCIPPKNELFSKYKTTDQKYKNQRHHIKVPFCCLVGFTIHIPRFYSTPKVSEAAYPLEKWITFQASLFRETVFSSAFSFSSSRSLPSFHLQAIKKIANSKNTRLLPIVARSTATSTGLFLKRKTSSIRRFRGLKNARCERKSSCLILRYLLPQKRKDIDRKPRSCRQEIKLLRNLSYLLFLELEIRDVCKSTWNWKPQATFFNKTIPWLPLLVIFFIIWS